MTNKLSCGAHIKSGSPNVFIGGPDADVAAVFDLEAWLHSGLEALGAAALIGGGVLAAAAGAAAFGIFAGATAGVMAAFEGLGRLGDRLGPGYRDLLQGTAGMAALLAGPKVAGAKRTSDFPEDNTAFNSGGDRLIDSMGPARINSPAEYNLIINDLRSNGVDISLRAGQFAYGPAPSGGRPGNIVFDPDASLSAIRHEYGHFLDDKALGFPGQRYYYENPSARLSTERSQYLGEIRTARELGDQTARRQLIQDYLSEKKYLIDNYYTKPYGSN